MLCLLEGELDQAVFNTLMSQFVTYLSAKEPDFVKLFEKFYAHRPGTLLYFKHISVSVIATCMKLPCHHFLQRNEPRATVCAQTQTCFWKGR